MKANGHKQLEEVIEMNRSPEKDIIFMLTKDEILACAGELGIPGDQVTDDVIELVKRRVNSEFCHWPEIVKGLLEEATECPLGLVCYASCFWWRDNRCTFLRDD